MDIKTKLAASGGGAGAAHVSVGNHDAVAILNLQVLLIQDGKFWVAQGLQIDYAAQGDSPEEAKTNFEKGLAATVDLNLRVYQNIKGLLVFASDAVLEDAARMKDSIELFGQVTIHQTGMSADAEAALPFDGISFLIANHQKAAA